MLYRPAEGRLWDPTVLIWKRTFYMFTMYYTADAPESYACRLATSADGVHWTDRGNVLKDDRPVWKCGVFRAGDGRFYMNYGSMSGSGTNDTMGYAVSDDLFHWTKLGYDHPDPRWYDLPERWDHMYVRESDHGGYVGFIVATPRVDGAGAVTNGLCGGTGAVTNGLCGLRRSADGAHWDTCPPPAMEWDFAEPTREMEVGGCEKLDGKWYLMGGICPPYNGNYGYSAYVFASDREEGPFRPCRNNRLCGQNGVPGEIFVACLPGFVHNCDEPNAPLLASNAMYYVLNGDTKNLCWVAPLERVEHGPDGLRLCWWEGTGALRGDALACAESVPCESRALPPYQLTDEYADAPVCAFDASEGLFLEGTLTAEPWPVRGAVRAGVWRPSAAGFALGGTAILVEAGSEGYSRAMVGPWQTDHFEAQDVTNPSDACRSYLTPDQPTPFTLLVRYGMARLYLDGQLVQSFVCANVPDGLRLCAKNARVRLDGLRAARFSL